MLQASTIQTQLGPLEILADHRGLIEIVLPGCSRKTTPPAASAEGESPVLNRAARQIQEFLAGQRTEFSLPLHLQGTTFQRRVWAIIRTIPYGQTMSYGAIAALLGNRNKARAAGGAAHANPFPLVIPCHRVIGSSGDLTGFRGGLNLKGRLLALENGYSSQ